MSTDKMQEGRKQYMQWLKDDRKRRLAATADKYDKIPENIRAAIAKVAGVSHNKRLTELSGADRKALKMAAKSLINKVTAAYGVLIMADFGGE